MESTDVVCAQNFEIKHHIITLSRFSWLTIVILLKEKWFEILTTGSFLTLTSLEFRYLVSEKLQRHRQNFHIKIISLFGFSGRGLIFLTIIFGVFGIFMIFDDPNRIQVFFKKQSLLQISKPMYPL